MQLKDVVETMGDFFNLPADTKRKYAYGGTEGHGWMALEQET